MAQDDFIAKQNETLESVSFLVDKLQKLSVIHVNNIASALNKWQEVNTQALEKDNLMIPSVYAWYDYLMDYSQRSVLFLDTLRQRADDILSYRAQGYPLIIKFDYQVLIDGRTLSEPCNYSLLKIKPLSGQVINEKLQPIVVIDPRGGHGAGIGGFKKDSEIGESLRAGHPTYFISFTHDPVEGQTLEISTRAQVKFIEEIIRRHPDAEKPVIIGNCQAGWSTMLLASENPSLPGLIIINGAPLSYWSGMVGQNPMRYSGGLLGGAWLTRFASDFGNGRFDGTWLVSNFENLNPSHTFWAKDYNLFSKVDTEIERFLDFERWWSNPILYNGNEIEAIVDDLFIGNRLTGSALGDGGSNLLQKIKSPIVVFCSAGDNITPPQQALNWIIDIYPNDIDLKKAGKTVVYLQHNSIGHLGIFVSGAVARREHRQLIASLDAVKALPPGLFEMIITDIIDKEGNVTDHDVFFKPRSISDLETKSTVDRIDEKVFPLVDRISQIHSNLYEILTRPTMQHIMTEPVAQIIRDSNTFYLDRIIFSSINPMFSWLPGVANAIKSNRHVISENNPLLIWQKLFSDNIIKSLDTYKEIRDASQETAFFTVYGSLTALTNFDNQSVFADTEKEQQALTKGLKEALTHGGIKEAGVRILLLLSHKAGMFDRDKLTKLIQHYRQIKSYNANISDKNAKEILTLQNLLVYSYPTESLNTLCQLLPDINERNTLLDIIEKEESSLINTNNDTKKLWAKINDVLLGKKVSLTYSTPQIMEDQSVKEEMVKEKIVKEDPKVKKTALKETKPKAKTKK